MGYDLVKCLGCGRVMFECDLETAYYIDDMTGINEMVADANSYGDEEEYSYCDCGCVDIITILPGEFIKDQELIEFGDYYG